MPKIKHPQHRSCFSCIYKDEILRPVKKSYVCPFNFSSQFPILNHILQSGHSSPGLRRNRILNLPVQLMSNSISVGPFKQWRTGNPETSENPWKQKPRFSHGASLGTCMWVWEKSSTTQLLPLNLPGQSMDIITAPTWNTNSLKKSNNEHNTHLFCFLTVQENSGQTGSYFAPTA